MSEEFARKIYSLNKGDLIRLFELIPEFQLNPVYGEMVSGEKTDEGLEVMPYFAPSQLVTQFLEITAEIPLTFEFDWIKWKEGEEILKNPNYNYHSLDMLTLCKLITSIIRYDRFSEGYLLSRFQDGTILKILQSIERKYN